MIIIIFYMKNKKKKDIKFYEDYTRVLWDVLSSVIKIKK